MQKKQIRSICQFCHTNCGIIATIDETGSISIQGDPDHPVNRGRLCAKAAAIPDIINSKDRLRHPLKKTKAGFTRISWDEALDFAAERLTSVREKYGPTSLIRINGAPVSYECRDGFLQFTGAFGSPNLTGAANLCMVPRMTAFKTVLGLPRPEPDYDNTGLVILWGTNPLESERYAAYSAYDGFRSIMPKLKEKHIPIYAIDPYRTDTVKAADHWLQLKPGTDVALALAMIQVIIAEELYDQNFVANYTSGFAQLKDEVSSCTPQWASEITGVPAAQISALARTYATTKPATIYEGNGLDMYTNGVESVRAIALLICLTGNLDVKGGNIFMPFAQQSALPMIKPDVQKRTWFDRFSVFGEVPFPAFKESVLGGDADRPRAAIVQHGNPVLTQANTKRTRQLFEALEFVMVNDIFPTRTTEVADLVLPMASTYESYGYRAYSSLDGGFLALANPLAEPVGEARSVFSVEYELARRMGLATDYPFSSDTSWIEHMLRPCGASFEKLKEAQVLTVTPGMKYEKFEQLGYSSEQGRIELYSTKLKELGLTPVPAYSAPARETLSEDYPLTGCSYRPGQFVHTKFKNCASLTKSYPAPLARLHPDEASGRQLQDGDQVVARSARGEATFTLQLSTDTPLGSVWVDFGWGNPTDSGGNINNLTDDSCFDPISGGTPNRIFSCEICKKDERD